MEIAFVSFAMLYFKKEMVSHPCLSLILTAEETQKARTFFLVTFFFALFFWVWAVKNTIEMDNNLDLGVVSFASVLVSSGYMLGVLSTGPVVNCVKWVKYATTGSHLFVAVNYLLGAFIGFTVMGRPGFGAYCAGFTFLWLGIAYYGYMLMHSLALGGETLPLSG